MNATLASLPDFKQIEKKLRDVKDKKKRLVLLDKLVGYYVFTNVRLAQTYLSEMEKILRYHGNEDLKLNYLINAALLANQYYNYKQSERYFKKALAKLEETGDIHREAETLIDYAGTCINLRNMDVANAMLDKSVKLIEALPDNQLAARIICRKAFLFLDNDLSKAIELLLQAQKRIQSAKWELNLKDHYFLALIYSGLGRIYSNDNNTEKGIRYHERALKISNALGMHTRLSWHNLNIGLGYLKLEEYEKSENYFRTAIKITDDISQLARAGAYANLGYCYFLKKEYNEAIDLYKKAERLYAEKRDENYGNFSKIEGWKARLFAEIGKNGKAERHFIKALELAKIVKDYKRLSNICKDIAVFYTKIEDYKTAYKYRVHYDELKELHADSVSSRIIKEMEVKYDAEMKIYEAEKLKLQATGLQLKALRAQMNPHFMYNALNAIQNFITTNNGIAAEKYLAKFARLMRQSLDYSDLESISLEKEVKFLTDYLLINQKLRFQDKLDYKIIIAKEIEEDIMCVPTMIVQPYVENAIEHGLRTKDSGLVTLEFSLKDDQTILCVVEDNGVGRQHAKAIQAAHQLSNHKSKGTSITEQRLKLLSKSGRKGLEVNTIDLKCEMNRPCGTRVEIQIPIVELI